MVAKGVVVVATVVVVVVDELLLGNGVVVVGTVVGAEIIQTTAVNSNIRLRETYLKLHRLEQHSERYH